MEGATVDRIEDWQTHPVSSGHDGLSELATNDFSGAVTNGTAWLFMLNGRIIGVIDGSVASFDDAEVTAYSAPHQSLPLLFAMQEQGGDTEARYYTEDTPLTEVDATLSEGGFTGFIELSENVLSGEYFVLYYGGQSMSVAFIGNARQLLTGDEAFDRANDEVGIYEVRAVDLEIHELPSTSPGIDDEPDTDDAIDDQSDAAPPGTSDSRPPGRAKTSRHPTAEDETVHSAVDPETGDAQTDTAATTDPDTEPIDPPAAETATREDRGTESDQAETSNDESDDGSPFAGVVEGSTPTDPDQKPGENADKTATERAGATNSSAVHERSANDEARDHPAEKSPSPPATSKDRQIASLKAELEEVKATRNRLREERDDLTDRIDRLRRQLESATGGPPESESSDGMTALSPGEALAQSDVFVRYGTRAEPTLEDAHAGRADRSDVLSNLRMEVHTRFEAESATVDGQPCSEYLQQTLQYRFVQWLVEDLLFEIRETNSHKRLRALFSALPAMDRAEFEGTVAVPSGDDEQGEAFDVVVRDRMGRPLIVADFNDARDPATGGMMDDLVTRTKGAAEGHESLGAAFMVTASFFEPAALETAEEATGGGLLNRNSRASYVKIDRKRGFHLCLTEARGGAFHVVVPRF